MLESVGEEVNGEVKGAIRDANRITCGRWNPCYPRNTCPGGEPRGSMGRRFKIESEKSEVSGGRER
jgi:hypothetical protein